MPTTSPANYGITNIYNELVEEWSNSLAQREMAFAPFCRIHTDNAAQIRRWGDLPVSIMPTRADNTAAIATQKVGATGVNSFAPVNKALKVAINNFDVIHNPGLVQKKLAQLQDAIISTSNSLVFGKLESGFTDVYDAGHGGNEALIGDQHRFANGTDGVLDEAQSNKVTTALSYDGISLALQKLQKFKDQAGTPLGLGMDSLVLIVPAELYSDAVNLVGSASLALSGDADVKMGSSNPYGSGQISVVSSAYLSDTNNWFLCETAASDRTPVNFWTSGLPTINVTVDESNLQTVITASAYMNAWIDGPAAGIVGSLVA
tara:strand:+ start:3114 stop:4067 length:954 start_codon:yes stop_codon:yes gene_type:complete